MLLSRRLALLLALIPIVASCGKDLKQLKMVDAPKTYHAIISLAPGTTEILAKWGADRLLRGRTESCNWPYFVTQPRAGIAVIAGVKPYIEKIAAMKPMPELAVYDTSLHTEQDVAKLKEMGIDLFAFKADTVDEFIGELARLGRTLSCETAISAYADKIVSARETATTNAPKPPWKVAIVADDMIAGKNSFFADEVRCAGGEPVGPESNKFEKLNAEALVAMNPQVILDVNKKAFDEFEKRAPNNNDLVKRKDRAVISIVRGTLLNDPRFSSIDAIKHKRIASGRPDIVYRKGGRVDAFISDLGEFLATRKR